MAYTDQHRLLLQYFMQERMVSDSDAQNANSLWFPETNIDNTIQLINSKITQVEMKINKVECEQSGKIFYVFISRFLDDFNTKHDQSKVMFLKLVDYIVAAGGSAPINKVLTFNDKISNELMQHYFSNKYCVSDKADNIFLTALAISELEGYLVEKFKGKICMCCMSIVSHGVRCQSCGRFAHGHCLAEYCKNIGRDKCPKCSKNNIDWGSFERPTL